MSKKQAWLKSDMTYYADTNAKALRDINGAITSLYAIDVGAYSANTRNTPIYVNEVITALHIDVAGWANKLEMLRSLVFGNDINWEYMAEDLGGEDAQK